MHVRRSIASACVAAALFYGAVAQAVGADPTLATTPQRTEAQTKFLHARELLKAQQYEAALAEFRASYDVVASPNARLSIARCLREMGRVPEAYIELERTSDEARALAAKEARYGETAAAADAEHAELATKLGFVKVTVAHASDDMTLKVGGRPIERAAWSSAIPVIPGAVDIVVESGGREVARASLTVGAGERKPATLDANPPTVQQPPPPPPRDSTEPPSVKKQTLDVPPTSSRGATALRPLAYVAGGVGVAGFATFAIAGLLEKGTYSDLQSQCRGVCPPDRAGDISAGRMQQTLANIGLVVGAVGVVTGVVLFVVSAPRGTPSSASAALVVTPSFFGVRGAL